MKVDVAPAAFVVGATVGAVIVMVDVAVAAGVTLSLDTTVTTDETAVLGKTVVTTGVAAIPGVLGASDTIFTPAVKSIGVGVNKSVLLVVCCNPVVNIAVAEAADGSVTGGDVGGVTVPVVAVVTMDGVVVIWEDRLGEPEVAVVVFAATVEVSGLWVAVPVVMELLVTPDKVRTTSLLPEKPSTTVLQVTDTDDVTVAAAGNPVCTAVEMGEIFPNKFELEDIPPG